MNIGGEIEKRLRKIKKVEEYEKANVIIDEAIQILENARPKPPNEKEDWND